MLTLVFDIHPVEASETIYIRADGSIDPPTVNIITLDNITYTFTDNIVESIYVERDSIIIDGGGFALEGLRFSIAGIVLTERKNVTIQNMEIRAFPQGVYLNYSKQCTIRESVMAGCDFYGIYSNMSTDNSIISNDLTMNSLDGICMWHTQDTKVKDNIMTNNGIYGIRARYSENNTISCNKIAGNGQDGIFFIEDCNNNLVVKNLLADHNESGIDMWDCYGNVIYHNNFINNSLQVNIRAPSYINFWTNGCEGNYWSNYNGSDLDNDGVGDTHLPWEGVDDCPLMNSYWDACDINHDLTVDMKDLGIAAKAYGSQPGDPQWNPHADITGPEHLTTDSTVDMRDIGLIARNFGETYPKAITLIGPWSGGEFEKFRPVLQRFEWLTGISVVYEVMRAEDLAILLPAQFAAGETPGDVIFMWSSFIQEKGQEGHILNVTNLVDENDFLPGTLNPIKVDDTSYGGAYTGKVKPGFWYKRSFFAKHGLSEPTTWNEFASLLDAIAVIPGIVNPIVSGDGVGWPLSDVTEHFLATFGGPELHRNLTAGTVAWNSTQVKTIFADRLVPLLQGNFSDPIEWNAALNSWWSESYGLYFIGSWITTMVDNATDLGFFTLPGNQGLVFTPDFFFIPAYTNYPEEARLLFQFLAGSEAQETQVAQGGHVSSNIFVSPSAYPDVDRELFETIMGKEVLTDLDDTIGGEFQAIFWNQLKLLWVDPTKLDNVLNAIEAVAP